MAKDMSNVYAKMLTKELVALRARHMGARSVARRYNTKLAHKHVERLTEIIAQINTELANRVLNFNLFV